MVNDNSLAFFFLLFGSFSILIERKRKTLKRFFFEFAISFFVGPSNEVEILGKVGKELDGMCNT
jgi:hypothetical protein